MRVTSALLCDFAEVREGLLFVLGAGISRVWMQNVPGPLSLCLAVVVEVDPGELTFPHEIRADLLGPKDNVLAQVRGGFQLAPAPGSFDPDEPGAVPLALDLRMVAIPAYGWHRFRISLDDEVLPDKRFKVAKPPQTPVVAPAKGRHN